MSPHGFIVEAIFDRLPSRSRTTKTGWTNFDCPICQEKRGRCGAKPRADGVGIYCFNCDFKATWNVGSKLFPEMREFLSALGISDLEIADLNHRASFLRIGMLKSPSTREMIRLHSTPRFECASLPVDAKSFEELDATGCSDPDFAAVKQYVEGRGVECARFQHYRWSSNHMNQMRRRVIIPFEYCGQHVGWTARAIDPDTEPRYRSAMQPNYLFNSFAMTNPKLEIAILVEGVFDAISINSVGMLGARLSAEQISWINTSRKKIILLPDPDERGLAMIDVALRERWHVAFPWIDWWEYGIKDAAQACKKYGKLYTLTSVIETSTDSPVRIAAHRLRLRQ